jgi:rhodanese-related sulfurtransferase
MKSIDPGTYEVSAQSPLLIDVRTPAEYEEVHIEESILHPLTQLQPDQIQKAAGQRGVCLVCRTGNRARQAAQKLEAAGIRDVLVLDGGVEGWVAAGRPVKRGRKTISLERQVRIAAGALVLVGVVLGFLVHPAWAVIPAFVGAGLIFAGLTDWCGMASMLARMPWNNMGGVRSCDLRVEPEK